MNIIEGWWLSAWIELLTRKVPRNASIVVCRLHGCRSALHEQRSAFLIAATGRRNVTPFGRHSSAPVNLVWGMLNAGSGYVVLRLADRRSGATVDGTQWQLPFMIGCVCWSSVGVVYAGATTRHAEP